MSLQSIRAPRQGDTDRPASQARPTSKVVASCDRMPNNVFHENYYYFVVVTLFFAKLAATRFAHSFLNHTTSLLIHPDDSAAAALPLSTLLGQTSPPVNSETSTDTAKSANLKHEVALTLQLPRYFRIKLKPKQLAFYVRKRPRLDGTSSKLSPRVVWTNKTTKIS